MDVIKQAILVGDIACQSGEIFYTGKLTDKASCDTIKLLSITKSKTEEDVFMIKKLKMAIYLKYQAGK